MSSDRGPILGLRVLCFLLPRPCVCDCMSVPSCPDTVSPFFERFWSPALSGLIRLDGLALWFSTSVPCLKSQVVYSKQPKLGLTQEFVVDCAHALWVVHSIRRLVSLMLLKWFLSDSFIYFMYRMFNENF